MTHFQENGKIEPKSDCKTAWSRIHEKAQSVNKKMKGLSGFSSKLDHRRPLSAKTVARKLATAEKIDRIMRAKRRYEFLAVNEKARVIHKDGMQFVPLRNEKGHFTGEKVIF